MTVADRVYESFKKYTESDYDNAAIQAFIAIDGTAKKVFKTGENKKRFTNLIKANLDLISKVIFLKDDIPEDEFINNKNLASLLYDMRCSILHEGVIGQVSWDKKRLAFENGIYLVPNSLIIALIFVVIAQPENIDENLEWGMHVEFFYKKRGIRFRFKEWIGDKNRIMNHFNHLYS
ncbi:MAG: hypothetical protein NTW32_27540 [Chloroflexi bacterium]|nr:hypothetical protein [Chloroflexota bacterium]